MDEYKTDTVKNNQSHLNQSHLLASKHQKKKNACIISIILVVYLEEQKQNFHLYDLYMCVQCFSFSFS